MRRTKRKSAARLVKAAKINDFRKGTTKREPFYAPEVFSFIDNPNETTRFFQRITSFITKRSNFGKDLFIDISQVKRLTIDALMYIIAVVTNLNRHFRSKYKFMGNFPQDSESRRLVRDSGFDKFVTYYGSEPINRNSDNIQIVSGDKVDPQLAKRICDFVITKGNVTRITTQFLYNMMIELMANVFAHAYSGSHTILYSRWYCFAEYDEKNNCIYFTFMDIGDGIPSTVRKRGLEVLGFKSDWAFVLSALKGELRSKTKAPYRGKGLPQIYSYCKNNLIDKMRIISNSADVLIEKGNTESSDLSCSLKGTLFYWRLDLSKLN